MPDFVRPDREITLGEIAALTRAKLRDGDPAERRIRNIAPLDTATVATSLFSTTRNISAIWQARAPGPA